jgi:hypothetical protein
MSNKNHPNNDYRSIDILDLSVDDWFTPFSELVKRQSTNQAKDQEVTDGPKPEQPDQEQQPEAESVQETTATARQTKERVVAEVALTGQSAGEKESVGSSQTGQDKPGVEVVDPQDTDPKESPAERLANDPAWQKRGYQVSDKVWEETLELQGFNKYGDYLLSDSRSKEAIDQERKDAVERANSAFTLADQLYSNPGWLPSELLQRELLYRNLEEENLGDARLVETLDAVHDLFDTDNSDDDIDTVQSNAIASLTSYNLDELSSNILVNNASDSNQYFSCVEHADSGCAGAIALYHLRKNLQDDEPIKRILRIADSGSAAEVREILNGTDKSDDVADYERKLGLIDRMVEQVDQYFDGAEAKENFTIKDLGMSREGNMLYKWIIVRSAEHRVAGLSEDELRRNTERYADSATIYGWILAWGGKNLFEMADQIHDKDVKARERRKAKSSRTA